MFPGGSGIIERYSRDLLGVFPETFFSTFLEVFTGVSQYFSDGFWTFLDNFYFFRGEGGPDSTGPLGPQGPMGAFGFDVFIWWSSFGLGRILKLDFRFAFLSVGLLGSVGLLKSYRKRASPLPPTHPGPIGDSLS